MTTHLGFFPMLMDTHTSSYPFQLPSAIFQRPLPLPTSKTCTNLYYVHSICRCGSLLFIVSHNMPLPFSPSPDPIPTSPNFNKLVPIVSIFLLFIFARLRWYGFRVEQLVERDRGVGDRESGARFTYGKSAYVHIDDDLFGKEVREKRDLEVLHLFVSMFV